jgi:hypothetical protein
MSYLTQNDIANSSSMQSRVAQCVAGEGLTGTPEQMASDPDRWTFDHRRTWAAAPDWDDAWEYALNTHGSEQGYDPGRDGAVITDGQILAQVQSMLS